jgi:hypothetical protein
MAGRNRKAPSLAYVRSAITNGSSILVGNFDGRTAWMRRLRDLIQLHESDLGGEDAVSESERRLVRRAAMLTLQLEMMDSKFAANDGEATFAQLHLYQQVSNTLRRLLESLGLKRRQKDITPPTLQEYLRQRQFESAEAAE